MKEEEGNEDEKKDKQPKKPLVITRGMRTSEYSAIFDFFTMELPPLVVKVTKINGKQFKAIDDLLQTTKSKENLPSLESKAAFSHLNSKSQLLIKTYLSNFLKLLKQ